LRPPSLAKRQAPPIDTPAKAHLCVEAGAARVFFLLFATAVEKFGKSRHCARQAGNRHCGHCGENFPRGPSRRLLRTNPDGSFFHHAGRPRPKPSSKLHGGSHEGPSVVQLARASVEPDAEFFFDGLAVSGFPSVDLKESPGSCPAYFRLSSLFPDPRPKNQVALSKNYGGEIFE